MRIDGAGFDGAEQGIRTLDVDDIEGLDVAFGLFPVVLVPAVFVGLAGRIETLRDPRPGADGAFGFEDLAV